MTTENPFSSSIIASRQAQETAEDQHHYKRGVFDIADRPIEGISAEIGPTTAGMIETLAASEFTARLGFTSEDIARHVRLIRNKRHAVGLVQAAGQEKDAPTAERLYRKAVALLVEVGVPEDTAKRLVENLKVRLTVNKDAVQTWAGAHSAAATASWEARAYGNRPATIGTVTAIDKHRAAEATERDAFAAMLDARKKCQAAIGRMTRFNLFGPAVDDIDDEPDGEPVASSTADSIKCEVAGTIVAGR